ncbi:MAG TPA: biopolymer transporter ExbD [Candidatus Angelobacter sp.]|nr:biopolymer transporter ExbD [Candidatus Angelobacter sp.]
MKLPRNARIFRGQLDAAPFASVFFLLIIFVILGTMLYAPGIQVKLPSAGDLTLAGAEGPTISVAVTTNAFYFDNQLISEADLSARLSAAAKKSAEPLTLVVLADKDVTEQRSLRLVVLAEKAGIRNLHLATMPRAFDALPDKSQP